MDGKRGEAVGDDEGGVVIGLERSELCGRVIAQAAAQIGTLEVFIPIAGRASQRD